MQLSLNTTTDNEHYSTGLQPCIENQYPDLAVISCYSDKGYYGPNNVEYIKRKRIALCIKP
ncbi:MAG: hypothetical protein LBQ28_06245 [Prevotellaceae bacterium]|jgi:hypothetical protein|nr:hypothetical protein [Prevotellaceae bacterium]